MHVVISEDEGKNSPALITSIVGECVVCEVESARLLSHISRAKYSSCLGGIIVVKSVVCEVYESLIIFQSSDKSAYYRGEIRE